MIYFYSRRSKDCLLFLILLYVIIISVCAGSISVQGDNNAVSAHETAQRCWKIMGEVIGWKKI